VVTARHHGCAEATRVRLPWIVPARAVRRVRCSECSREFEAEAVDELNRSVPQRGSILDRLDPRDWFDPSSLSWRIASIPIAAALVIGGLLVLRGGDDQPHAPAGAAAPSAPAAPAARAARAKAAQNPHGKGGETAKASKHTVLVKGSSFNLALPAHWEQVDPPTGATFKAVSPDGGADATLWIKRDASLSFAEFVNQSSRQLKALAGVKPKVEQDLAPTPDESTAKLTAKAPPGQPTYQVTLRASGDYRYYLAVSIQPDASSQAANGADLIDHSFTPEGSG
jgi:hypothetical protein